MMSVSSTNYLGYVLEWIATTEAAEEEEADEAHEVIGSILRQHFAFLQGVSVTYLTEEAHCPTMIGQPSFL